MKDDQVLHRLGMRTALLTLIAMLAFAANSVLCRLALAEGAIDPASFTFVRIASGALTLWLILLFSGRATLSHGSWLGATALFVYAAAFSFGYISLPAGTGAFLLFGAVQVTMVLIGIICGERLTALQCLGFILAIAGLAVLVAPGSFAPSLVGAGLMILAGMAWGAYSLLGRGSKSPVLSTAGNFVRALPMVGVLMVLSFIEMDVVMTSSGVIFAILSGAVASGLGYTIWYAALPGLTPAQGASVQLSVPVITAVAGTIVLNEQIDLRLLISSVAILGGIGLIIAAKNRQKM
ncbi:DMT family transporter [Castellaniella sp.]|uniref:DMT family transporter n=1 Tax=Castellaniella sp. TaxID=1955812 RepID=UPI002AFF0C11|nr:DMT family transporter [Castellaniella sp.]